jgi:hypothetical protein
MGDRYRIDLPDKRSLGHIGHIALRIDRHRCLLRGLWDDYTVSWGCAAETANLMAMVWRLP